jgi:HEAT repeat protein
VGLSAAERRALIEALGSEDPEERAYGAFELAEARARSARPSIEALLEDAVPLVRGAAAYALWRLADRSGAATTGADPGAPAVKVLVPLLSSQDEETCQLAVHALGRMGAAAIPGLERAAGGRSRHRAVARRVLAEIQGEALE